MIKTRLAKLVFDWEGGGGGVVVGGGEEAETAAAHPVLNVLVCCDKPHLQKARRGTRQPQRLARSQASAARRRLLNLVF